MDEQAQEQEFDLDTELTNTLREINEREGKLIDQQDDADDVDLEVDETEEEPEQPEGEKAEAKPEKKEAEPEPDDEPEESIAKPEKPEQKTELKRPPSSWSAKGKAEFAKLPSHIQDEVLKRESDFHNGIQQYKEKAEQADRIGNVIRPYEAIIRASNSTPEKAIANLMDTAYRLNTGTPEQKAQTLMQVAQQYNIDLNSLTQQKDERPAYVRQLEQQLAQLQGSIQSQQQYAQQQTAQEAQGSIEQFRNETDENGSPKHLYFDDVREDMADRIDAAARQGRQLSLQDAYDAAIWARADIRETLMTAKQQEDELKRKQAQAQKARDAKRKAQVNITPTGNHAKTSTKANGSIEDTMRETMAQLKERDA